MGGEVQRTAQGTGAEADSGDSESQIGTGTQTSVEGQGVPDQGDGEGVQVRRSPLSDAVRGDGDDRGGVRAPVIREPEESPDNELVGAQVFREGVGGGDWRQEIWETEGEEGDELRRVVLNVTLGKLYSADDVAGSPLFVGQGLEVMEVHWWDHVRGCWVKLAPQSYEFPGGMVLTVPQLQEA